jgi:hypothetical protein
MKKYVQVIAKGELMSKRVTVSLALMACLMQLGAAVADYEARPTGQYSTINWSGRTWYVYSGGPHGPGGNYYSANNVWKDSSTGYLHVRLSKSGSTWYCADLYTTTNLTYGKYQWWVDGRIDLLDSNVVLGLYNYGGVDNFNEVDIEYGKRLNKARRIGNFGAYPNTSPGGHRSGDSFNLSLSGTFTTQRFTWRSNSIYFQGLHGHHNDNANQYYSYTTPTSWASHVPNIAMPVYITLWLKSIKGPSNGQPVEIVIENFTYSP